MVDDDYSRLCLMFILLVDALWRVGRVPCAMYELIIVVLKRFCVFS
jgi:hypothetical protein